MRFIYNNNRQPREQATLDSALKNQWSVMDVFSGVSFSETRTEEERLKWAPVLCSLAFGEGTAFYGFGQRIAEADDISAKSWLSVHLVDEARHTEGFSRLLDYLYPSYDGRHEELMQSRDVFVFYGHTHRAKDLLEWLICTQIAEVFGRQCYKGLFNALASDTTAHDFIGRIIGDENRHISYISTLIQDRRNFLSDKLWSEHYAPFTERMTHLARNMFEAKRRGLNFHSFEAMEIDVTAFCDHAVAEIHARIQNMARTEIA